MEFWQTLAAVVVGGLIAPVGTILVGLWEKRQAGRSLERALLAEVAVTLEVVERRGHVALLQEYIDAWKRGEALSSMPTIHGIEEDQQEETVIFDSLVGRIGELDGETAMGIVQFVGLFRGIKHDLRAISRGNVPDVKDRIRLLEEVIELWQKAERIGRSLTSRLS